MPWRMSRAERAQAVRDLAIAFARAHGRVSSGISMACKPPLDVWHRTPFHRLPKVPDRQKYALAVSGKSRNLPYGLDIWYEGKKVFNIEWDDSGRFEILSFRRGPWERELTEAVSDTTE